MWAVHAAGGPDAGPARCSDGDRDEAVAEFGNATRRREHARSSGARIEDSDVDRVRHGIEEIKRRVAGGPPDGVPAVGGLVLHQPDEGKVLAITLFETEDDLRQGDATLNAMDPPAAGSGGTRGSRSVDVYEVAVARLDTKAIV